MQNRFSFGAKSDYSGPIGKAEKMVVGGSVNFEMGHLDRSGVHSMPLHRKGWRPPASALRIRLFTSLVLLDTLSILIGFMAAAAIRGSLTGDTSWIVIVAILLPVFIGTAINSQGYSAASLQDPFRAIAKGLQAFLLALAAVIFIAFCLKTSESFPRLVVTIGTAITIFLLVLTRYFFVRHMDAIIGGNPFSIILIRDGDQPIPDGKFSVMLAADAYFDPDQHDPVMYDRLAKSLASADRVIVVCAIERRMAWAHALKGANVQSEIVVPELQVLAPLGVGVHGGMPTVVVANGPLGLVDRLVKRAFDVSTAAAALVLLSPLLVAIAILIKLDSRGPIFFKQTRIGRGNRMFKMLKFRSMRVDGSDGTGARSTARDDDRVTRIGRIIRSTSIDELPQLVNVLKGDMSIVGPRPHALGSRAEDKLFWEVDQRYWHRHAAKPGLTGLAQVRGYRGATLVEADLRNRLLADLEYLDTWSIWRDLKIILMTFRVLFHRNAF